MVQSVKAFVKTLSSFTAIDYKRHFRKTLTKCSGLAAFLGTIYAYIFSLVLTTVRLYMWPFTGHKPCSIGTRAQSFNFWWILKFQSKIVNIKTAFSIDKYKNKRETNSHSRTLKFYSFSRFQDVTFDGALTLERHYYTLCTKIDMSLPLIDFYSLE